MKLIDKDKIVTEIEKIQNEFSDSPDRNGNFDDLENQGAHKALDRLESFLDTIETKEVDLNRESTWKPADGDVLPEIDREVVVLYQHYPLDVNEYSVGFAHRPPEYWDGKNIETGVVTRYFPKKYGKGGWSSPDVKWWLDLDLPKPKVEE